jgi:hypothetical protein
MIPSVKTLMNRLGLDFEKAKRIRWIMEQTRVPALTARYQSLTHTGTVAEAAMQAINEELGLYGVECIRDGNMWERYWCDHCLMYANTGETYTPTILYETQTGRFIVTDLGTWLEEPKQSKRNFAP